VSKQGDPESVAVVNEYYEALRKDDNSDAISISIIERRYCLAAGQLRYFRANRKRRKISGVNLIHNGGRRRKQLNLCPAT